MESDPIDLFDMLKAWELSWVDLGTNGGLWSDNRLTLNGLTDPTYGFTSHQYGGHSIGMSIDLGLGAYIDGDHQNGILPGSNPFLPIFDYGWSVANAAAWSGLLPDTRGSRQQPINDQRDALRNFLALYAVTRKDDISGNGTWDDLGGLMVNKAALPYLFGDGSDMIARVLIGGASPANPYDSIHQVLDNLGIVSQAKTNHNTHFHIDLRAPAIKLLDPPQNLLAGNIASELVLSEADAALLASAQAQVDDAAKELNINQGELAMFIMDVPPDVPQQYAPVVIAQAAQTKDTTKTDRTIGVCHLVENDPDSRLSAVNAMSPVGVVWSYFQQQEHITIDESIYKAAKITLLQTPKHGELDVDSATQSAGYFSNDFNYFGPDRATLLVEIGNYKVKIEYFFKLMEHVPSGTQGSPYTKENCPKNSRVWKISLDANGNQVLSLVDSNALQTEALASSLLNSQLGAGSGITVNIADLPGGALGQTTGTSITLDDNAAGHNWFIDTTPADNSEFLPTSNPNEWVAKEGSAAYGKMDMLSVLLHEYGHALGIEHSADANDYMGATLTAGVRRLPSADELALMQQLVAGIQTQ